MLLKFLYELIWFVSVGKKRREGTRLQTRRKHDWCKAMLAYFKSLALGGWGGLPTRHFSSIFFPPVWIARRRLLVELSHVAGCCRAHQVRLMRNFDGAICHFDIDTSCLETSWTHSPHRPLHPSSAVSLCCWTNRQTVRQRGVRSTSAHMQCSSSIPVAKITLDVSFWGLKSK